MRVDHMVESFEAAGQGEYLGRCGKSDELKERIVAESYAPGAVVSEVARPARHPPQQFFVGARRRAPRYSGCRPTRRDDSFRW